MGENLHTTVTGSRGSLSVFPFLFCVQPIRVISLADTVFWIYSIPLQSFTEAKSMDILESMFKPPRFHSLKPNILWLTLNVLPSISRDFPLCAFLPAAKLCNFYLEKRYKESINLSALILFESGYLNFRVFIKLACIFMVSIEWDSLF